MYSLTAAVSGVTGFGPRYFFVTMRGKRGVVSLPQFQGFASRHLSQFLIMGVNMHHRSITNTQRERSSPRKKVDRFLAVANSPYLCGRHAIGEKKLHRFISPALGGIQRWAMFAMKSRRLRRLALLQVLVGRAIPANRYQPLHGRDEVWCT